MYINQRLHTASRTISWAVTEWNRHQLRVRPALFQTTRVLMKAAERIVSKEVLRTTKFLRLVDIGYVRGPDYERVRHWQSVERTTTDAAAGIDAVSVFAVVKRDNVPPGVIIVKQFRPPLGKHTIELCAGLVDEGETVEEAALRELQEETGYRGRVVGTTGRQYLSPGLTNENIEMVFVEVDGDAPEHQEPPQQSQEDSGFIQVEIIPVKDLYLSLKALEEQGYGVWVGLYTIAQGMRLNTLLGLETQ